MYQINTYEWARWGIIVGCDCGTYVCWAKWGIIAGCDCGTCVCWAEVIGLGNGPGELEHVIGGMGMRLANKKS